MIGILIKIKFTFFLMNLNQQLKTKWEVFSYKIISLILTNTEILFSVNTFFSSIYLYNKHKAVKVNL